MKHVPTAPALRARSGLPRRLWIGPLIALALIVRNPLSAHDPATGQDPSAPAFSLLAQAAGTAPWTILDVPVFDDDLYKLVIRFLFNAIFLALVFLIATSAGRLRRAFAFPVIMMNLMAFFICFTMKKLDLGLGMALGLFAIFAVLRYRTQSIRVKEMTYLFIGIGIAVINALSNKKTSYLELLMVNSIITSAALLIEAYMARDRREQHTVTHDRIDLLAPDKRPALIADLYQRTGLDITDIEIQRIDLRNDRATLLITSRVQQQPQTSPGSEER
ncbi:MAG: hypothetical protein CMJ75_01430 [Planctomycetaceae bacterium]|nr:hypothetical protein [Planctomycetaceae bacterium]